MAHFVVDDPLGAAGKVVHDKDVAARDPRTSDIALIKEKLPMDTGLGKLGSKGRDVVSALAFLSFALNGEIAGQAIVR
jgi:hypothetical protein